MSKQKTEFVEEVTVKLSKLEGSGIIKGLGSLDRRFALAGQIAESYRRIRYVQIIQGREVSRSSCEPSNESFDPLKAAIVEARAGRIDESLWMVFYFVHFGKNLKGGWRYAREVFNALGQQSPWTWEITKQNPKAFRKWLANNIPLLKRQGVPGGFGNHRKYTSLDANASDQTGAAFETYVNWIGPANTHLERFKNLTSDCADCPGSRFDTLYQSMSSVSSFGRMAKFDYLCMVGKLRIFDVEPFSVYVANATGPKKGGKLLFGGNDSANLSNDELERLYAVLRVELDLPFSMQILEDAVCNWQKSPAIFRAFRG